MRADGHAEEHAAPTGDDAGDVWVSVNRSSVDEASRHRPSPPRNFLERSERRRLFWLVMPPALVLILLGLWVEETFLRPPSGPAPTQVDTRLRGGARGTVDGEIADAVVIEPDPQPFAGLANDRGAPAEVLAKVRDDTVFRDDDSDAWFALWETLLTTDATTLARSAGSPVGFSELFGQPRSFRGKPVRMRGTLRRLQRVEAAANALGIEGYWQGWLDPEGGPASPVVVYFLELPPAVHPGMRIIEPVDVVGFFFKRWAYQATDTIRTAPLLMSRTPIPLTPPTKPADTNITLVLLWTGGIIAMAGIILFLRRRSRRPYRHTHARAVLLAALLCCTAGWATAAEPLTAEAYFSRFGLAAADRAALGSISQWSDARLDVSLKLLARLAAAPAGLRESWNREATPPSGLDLESAPQASGDTDQLVRVSGRAVMVRELPLSAEFTERHSRQTIHLVRLTDSDGKAMDLIAEHVPDAWPRETAIDEPADAVGVLVGHEAGPLSPPPALTLATHRVAWRPGTPLGALGMDYGLFDAVKDGRKLVADDADAFYGTLAAAGRAKPDGLENASSDVAILELIDPQVRWLETHRGSPLRIRGTARRAIRIAIDDPYRQQQLGTDHYWELYVFVSTPTAVQINDRLQENYPLVCCVLELPAGMPTGERITEDVEVAGFAFKRYRYPLAANAADEAPQESPLIIGRTLRWLPETEPAAARQLESIFGGLLVVVVLLLLAAGWASSRRPRPAQEARVQIAAPADADAEPRTDD